MYKYLVVILLSFLLYGCAASGNVPKNISGTEPKGKVHIVNALGGAAVKIDDNLVGTTPLDVMLPVGEHKLTLNYLGKVILDSTIVVTDDYERNMNTALVGSIVGGFVPFLLLPFPVNLVSLIVPVVTMVPAEQLSSDKIILNDFAIAKNSGIAVNAPKQHFSAPTFSVNDSVEVATEVAENFPEMSEFYEEQMKESFSEVSMHKINSDKFKFLQGKQGKKSAEIVKAESICYDPKEDLVWTYHPWQKKTFTYQSNDFLPCDVESLPYSSDVKAGLIGFAISAGVGAIVGAIGGGGKGALAGAASIGAVVGLPAFFITSSVVNNKNVRACQRFRDSEQVKEWYSHYRCRQNTNPIPESKNQ